MATPFPFSSGQVLTAAQMNAITELPINDKTASHTLTAADAGDYVIMNSASATTITVNTGIFTAGQVVFIVNKGTASTVITQGTATVTSSGSLTVPANGSGRLLALSASAFIYEAGGITAAASAFSRVTGATFTAATSVAFANSTFTSSFNSYQVVLALTAFPSSTSTVTMQVRDNSGTKSSAQYIGAITGRTSDANTTSLSTSFATSFSIGTAFSGSNQGAYSLVLTVNNPANASFPTSWSGTGFGSIGGDPRSSILVGGYYNVNEAHTGLVFSFSVAVSGYYNVYSLADS
jgi:hypothetical protein